MENKAAKITDSELEIMKALWEFSYPLNIGEIRKILEERSQWEASTIKTLLRRLCKKEVVEADKKEVFYYSPLVSEEAYNKYKTQHLINKVYKGSAKNLIASLLGSEKLEKKDIDELRAMFKVEDE